jgi:hypothetical protein
MQFGPQSNIKIVRTSVWRQSDRLSLLRVRQIVVNVVLNHDAGVALGGICPDKCASPVASPEFSRPPNALPKVATENLGYTGAGVALHLSAARVDDLPIQSDPDAWTCLAALRGVDFSAPNEPHMRGMDPLLGI